ncbi:MAG: ATP-binding protein [Pseudomonadota bacterium]
MLLDLRRDLVAAARANRAQQRWSTSLGILMGVSVLMLFITIMQFARYRRLHAALDAKLRLEALGRLTGGVAHDFNNMLAVIRQSIDLLRTQKLGNDAQAILDEAAHATGTAGALVRQLLDFSRGRESEPKEIELTSYLERNTPLLRRTAGESIALQVEGEQGIRVHADADQLTAVLINLVANARDAMQATGTILVRAWRESSPAGERVAVSVSDSGEGIATADRNRVFEPFFTTKGNAGGVGLGLSMVFGLVKRWGGEIDLQSEMGGGTVVTLWLRSA